MMSIQKSTRPQVLISQALAEVKKALPQEDASLSAQQIQALPTPLKSLADSFGQEPVQGSALLSAFETTLQKGLAQSLKEGTLVGTDLSPEIESLLSFNAAQLRATTKEMSFEQNFQVAHSALEKVEPELSSQLNAFRALKSLSESSQNAAPQTSKYFAGVVKERARSIRKAADAAVTHFTKDDVAVSQGDLAAVLKDAIAVHQAVNPRSTSVKALQKKLNATGAEPTVGTNLLSDFFSQHVPKGPPLQQEPVVVTDPETPTSPVATASPKIIVEKAQVVILKGFYQGFGNMRDAMLELQDQSAASENVKAQNELTLRAYEAGLKGLSGIEAEIADIAQQMTLEIFSPTRDERLAAEMQMFGGLKDRFQKLSDYADALERRRDIYPSKGLEIGTLKLFVEGADAMESRIEVLDQMENPSVHESAELEALTHLHEGGDSISERIEEMEDLMSRARMTPEAHANMTMSVALLKSLLGALKRFS